MEFTIEQALAVRNVPQRIKSYLELLKDSKLPTAKNKIFTAQNQTALISVLNAEYERYNKSKQKREQITQCHQIIDSLLKGNKTNRRLISADELLPKLQALKEEIEQEKAYKKVNDFVESSGMTKEQLIEYLQNH